MKLHYVTLLLAMAWLLTGVQTVKAQKVVLHMTGNQKAEYSTQLLDSITFVDVDSPDVEPSTDPSITSDAIDITQKSATLIGYTTSIHDNLANDLRVGFIYCLEGVPSKNNGTQITVNKNDVAEDGRYMATIENLLSNATYYFRSFVYQSGLWFYGKVKSFITEGFDVNFTTGDATDITCFSAKVSGSVNIQSSYSILEYGICYGTGIEPTIDNNKVVATSENFTLQLRQLTGGTDYYYRPYIIIDGQAYYGTVHTFRTLDDNVVETGDIDKKTFTVTSHLTIGGGAYSSLVLGVCYGTTELPTINDNTFTSNEVDEENNYTIQIVNLGTSIIYYRAYILIDGIPHYGKVKKFIVPDVISVMESDAECSLFYEAMSATGLCELLNRSSKDESWDYCHYLSYEKEYSLPSFFQYCHIPRTREEGATVFACTNETLKSRYGIHDLQGFYDFALSVYGGAKDDALRKLLSYCIIDRKSTLERLTTLCSIDTLVSQPTEWYSTLLPHSLLKVTKSGNHTFLNMSGNLSGICISKPQCDNICGNGSYYLTDGLPLYNEECRSAFASERMRMDFYTLVPELENVMMRSSASYYLPNDYLHCLSASVDTYIIYEDVHESSPFYEGDCLWLCGRYDVTFKLPAVPKQGTYEIRIGYTAMPNNGIAQIYLGTDTQNMFPVGIPMSFNRDANANGLPWIPLSSADEEESLNSRKAIRNYGFMHGPSCIYYVSEPNTIKKFCDNPSTLRSIVVRQSLEENTQYYLRFKSVVDGDRPICLDYIELVHKDVYDNSEIPEDIY